MPFITATDLHTHLYAEVIEEIVRNDSSIVEKAISSAIAEAKAYCSRYDTEALFADDSEQPHLKQLVKDIACWHIIRLANPNIHTEFARTCYEDALNFLKSVMKGQADPVGWPYPTITTTPGNGLVTDKEGNVISWSSNNKRNNHY